MRDRKKIALLCLWFLLCFMGVSLTLDFIYERWVIRHHPYSNLAIFERLLYARHEDEIPVFGSSKARYSFIPDSLSPNVFNYAMPRCNFDVIEFLLELELQKEKNTPILMEFNHRFFLHNPQYTINTATFIPNVKEGRVRAFLKKNKRLEPYHFIPGLRYYGKYVNFINTDLRELVGSSKTFSRGAIISKKRTNPDVFEKTVRGRHEAAHARKLLFEKANKPKSLISMEEKQKLQQLDLLMLFYQDSARVRVFEDLLQTNPNRTFVLVYTPQHESEMAGLENEKELLLFWETLTQKHPNLLFLNYSHMSMPDSNFKDPSHLNIFGAGPFCKKLLEDLRSDPRTNPFF